MAQSRKSIVVDKAHSEFKRVYDSIPKEYQDLIIALEQGKNIGSKSNPEWVNYPVAYMPVAGRLKMMQDEHEKKKKHYLLTGFTNTDSTPKEVHVEIPLWAMPGPASEQVWEKDMPPNRTSLRYTLLVPGNSHVCLFASALKGIHTGVAGIKAYKKDFALEDAETSAIGRALGSAGYGLTGSGVSSMEEVLDFLANSDIGKEMKGNKKESKPSDSKGFEVPAEKPDVSKLKRYAKDALADMAKKEVGEILKELRIAMNLSPEDVDKIFKSIRGLKDTDSFDRRSVKKEELIQVYIYLAGLAHWGD